jgi:hypothetical protein
MIMKLVVFLDPLTGRISVGTQQMLSPLARIIIAAAPEVLAE